MTSGRIGIVATVAVAALACAPRTAAPSVRPDAPDAVGLYRAAARDGDARAARFRLWVHAARPDRLHLEVVPPVGGTAFILDAGGGDVAASWVADRVALAGASDAASMERLLGLAIDARGWVATLLDGAPAEGVLVERDGDPGRLPLSLVVRRGSLEVRLERREVTRATGLVGTGRAPEGFEVHPIAAMVGPALLDALLEPEEEGAR